MVLEQHVWELLALKFYERVFRPDENIRRLRGSLDWQTFCETRPEGAYFEELREPESFDVLSPTPFSDE